MKKTRIMALLAAVLLSVLFGCATTSDGGATVAEPVQSTKAVVKEAEPAPKPPEPEFERIVIRESFLFPEGDLDNYVEYEYDSDHELLLEERLYDSERLLIESKSYTYSGDAVTELVVRDATGAVLLSERYFYDEAGNLVIQTVFDELNEVMTSSWYEYDADGRRISWSVTDEDDLVLGMLRYTLDGDDIVRTDVISPEGELEEYILYTYDERRNLTAEDTFLPNGETVISKKYLFVGNWLSEVQNYRSNGLSGSITYRDNPDAGIITVEYRDADGGIQEIRVREYVKKEVAQ